MAFDQNYVTPFYVLITSVFQNNRCSSFHIHTIITGIADKEKEDIRRYVQQHNSTVSFYSVDAVVVAGLAKPKHSFYTSAIYYRLFFPEFLPATVTKLMYLDTDIVVIGNLAELYATELGNYPAGAVAEVNATKNRPDLGIHEVGVYFNSGVMLMNIPEWKRQKVSERAMQYIHDFPEKIIFPDQDALNVVLMHNYVKLNAKFNVIPYDIPRFLPRRKYQKFLQDKVVIHYTLKDHKPWSITSLSKFRYLYHNYLHQSPRAFEKKYKDYAFTLDTIKTFLTIRIKEALLNLPNADRVIHALNTVMK